MDQVADTLISIGCDYITVTAPEDHGRLGLHSQASALFRAESDRGNITRAWGMAGFKGWQCGCVQVGSRDDLCMVRLSSHVARRSWRSIAGLATKVTRFDLQATIKLECDVDQRLREHRRDAMRDAKRHKDQRIVKWVQDNRGGFTLYLGSRESLAFGRAYNKWAESMMDHYRNCIRYEVEFKGKLAQVIVSAMLLDHAESFRASSYITQFFKSRQVNSRLPVELPATYCCSRQRSDVDRNLEWLKASVRPTVSRLIALGKGEEVFRALGLIVDDK